jgi:hypothetical protein
MARRKADKPQVKQYGYKIAVESDCNESYHSGKQYGEWRESYSNHLSSIATHDDEYPDVVSIHNIEPGQAALVVWIEWSTGDSFGHSDRGCTEIIGLFRDLESAESLRQQIKSWRRNDKSKKWDEQNSYHFKTPDGQEFTSGFAPWSGYFDSLDSVNIDSVGVF